MDEPEMRKGICAACGAPSLEMFQDGGDATSWVAWCQSGHVHMSRVTHEHSGPSIQLHVGTFSDKDGMPERTQGPAAGRCVGISGESQEAWLARERASRPPAPGAYRVQGLYHQTIEAAEKEALAMAIRLDTDINVFVGDSMMIRSIAGPDGSVQSAY